jgi:hypothetical protein
VKFHHSVTPFHVSLMFHRGVIGSWSFRIIYGGHCAGCAKFPETCPSQRTNVSNKSASTPL